MGIDDTDIGIRQTKSQWKIKVVLLSKTQSLNDPGKQWNEVYDWMKNNGISCPNITLMDVPITHTCYAEGPEGEVVARLAEPLPEAVESVSMEKYE